MDNFRKIRDYQKKQNVVSDMNKDVIKQSMVETEFYEEYSSFVVGLRNKLKNLLVQEGNSEVILKPVKQDKAKYFERAMEDSEFNTVYHMRRTKGGEYSFRQISLSEVLSKKVEYDDYIES